MPLAKPNAQPHGTSTGAIIVWCNEWFQHVPYLESQIQILNKKVNAMDATVTKLQADLDTLKTDVTNTIGSLKTQLAAALASAGQTPADVTAALQAMDAEVTALDASVNPPPTTP